ncbi:MAG: very short patch repair endonuclease [Planctomycetaceae bacterium]|nr:very short patch repair endonuclease [Planctomycetaceae bacterium]
MDVHSRIQRSQNMASIRAKNTSPEIAIRKLLHREGFRFRIHSSSLPGKPDIVLPKYHAVILVNGCFWHLHRCCLSKLPQSRADWWRRKLEGNRQRDLAVRRALIRSGWRVLTIWECAFRGKGSVSEAMRKIADEAAMWLRSTSRERQLSR